MNHKCCLFVVGVQSCTCCQRKMFCVPTFSHVAFCLDSQYNLCHIYTYILVSVLMFDQSFVTPTFVKYYALMLSWFMLLLQREDTVQPASQPPPRPSLCRAGTGAAAVGLELDWARGP